MPYIIIEDFRTGLDRRKMAEASAQGSLQTLKNAHITRGGEIEKRLALVAKYALPAGQTFGFAGANGVRYVFGSEVAPAVPSGVTYQRLAHPGGQDMTRLIYSEFYDGKVWAVAEYANGDVLHFYDGTQVADWSGGSGATVAGEQAKALLTHRDKMYAIHSSVLSFSSIAAPTQWQTGTGYGFKNMSNQSAGSEDLTALGRYQNLVAVFAQRNIQIWYLDPDPLQNVQRQVLENIGTFAPRSVKSFGNDVVFLAHSGFRSLRVRDSSNQSGVSDIGTPIDSLVVEHLATLTEAQRAAACGVLEASSGRYMAAVGDKVFCFTYSAADRISAWSIYEFGFTISEFVDLDGKVWARSGDTIYVLGGDSGTTHDSSEVIVETPYIDGRQLATFKDFSGIDVVCEGEWSVYANTDPAFPNEWSLLAVVSGTTLLHDALAMVGHSPLIKLKFVNTGSTAAKLSKLVVHYNAAEAS